MSGAAKSHRKAAPRADAVEDSPPRRRYDSPVRRRQAAETRDRIIKAGAELIHGFPVWNWRALTARTVAGPAGVNERTVYRYFPSERELRDAVLERLEEESGVHFDGLTLDQMKDVTTRLLHWVSSFPLESRVPADETVAAAYARQRQALLHAVSPVTEGWSAFERAMAAAMFDVLWSTVAFERLVTQWEFTPEEATTGVTWAMSVLEEAIRHGHRPSS